MSRGGIPVQPYFVLGGFIPPGEAGFPAEPNYASSSAIVMTFIMDNYDHKTSDPVAKRQLQKAMNWEAAFVKFMQEWTADEKNTLYMDVAFNSERSIEDELERETSGDVLTIAVSYLIMFFYITFSLGQVSSVDRFMVSTQCFKNANTVINETLCVYEVLAVWCLGVFCCVLVF